MKTLFLNQLKGPEIFGYAAALLTTIAFLPQLIRTFKTKSSSDISLVMLIMFMTGLAFWIIYGWETNSIPILAANITTLILNSCILVLKIIYNE